MTKRILSIFAALLFLSNQAFAGAVLPVNVTAGSPDVVISPSPGKGTFTVSKTAPINAIGTSPTYTVLASDMGKVVTHARSTSVAVTLPQATTTGFGAGKSYTEINTGAGAVTITPTTSTINGLTSLVLAQYQSAYIVSDGTNYVAFLGSISSTSVSVTSVSSNLVINPTPGTGTFTLGTTQIINAQGTAASYTILSSDMGKVVTHNKSTAVAVTLPQATTTGFTAGASYTEFNLGAGAVTITPTTSTINGASTYVLSQNQGIYIVSNGTDYIGIPMASGSGTGTVTTFSCVTANGVSCSVANASTTPAATFTLGNITPAKVNATASITAASVALSVSGAAIATDASLGNHFRVTPAHSTATTMSAPTNPVDGQKITYELVQDSTGSGTITWNSVFSFGTSGAPTLTTTASKRDLVGFVYSSDAVKWLYLGSQLNF